MGKGLNVINLVKEYLKKNPEKDFDNHIVEGVPSLQDKVIPYIVFESQSIPLHNWFNSKEEVKAENDLFYRFKNSFFPRDMNLLIIILLNRTKFNKIT